jgi:hypothetical protein
VTVTVTVCVCVCVCVFVYICIYIYILIFFESEHIPFVTMCAWSVYVFLLFCTFFCIYVSRSRSRDISFSNVFIKKVQKLLMSLSHGNLAICSFSSIKCCLKQIFSDRARDYIYDYIYNIP